MIFGKQSGGFAISLQWRMRYDGDRALDLSTYEMKSWKGIEVHVLHWTLFIETPKSEALVQ